MTGKLLEYHLKNPRVPLVVRVPQFENHCSSWKAYLWFEAFPPGFKNKLHSFDVQTFRCFHSKNYIWLIRKFETCVTDRWRGSWTDQYSFSSCRSTRCMQQNAGDNTSIKRKHPYDQKNAANADKSNLRRFHWIVWSVPLCKYDKFKSVNWTDKRFQHKSVMPT